MSDQNTPQTTNDEKPRPKRTKRESYTVSQMAVKRAKARGIDTSRAAKEVRSRLRANFDTVCKLDPSIKKHKTRANDGNRWPAMNAKVAEFVLSPRANRSQ